MDFNNQDRNQMKMKALWKKIKSKYIFKNIFNILPKRKFLQISQYNKKIQNILNINS